MLVFWYVFVCFVFLSLLIGVCAYLFCCMCYGLCCVYVRWILLVCLYSFLLSVMINEFLFRFCYIVYVLSYIPFVFLDVSTLLIFV